MKFKALGADPAPNFDACGGLRGLALEFVSSCAGLAGVKPWNESRPAHGSGR